MKTIREHRIERGWTQFGLGLKVGVQPLTVSLWERGRRIPQVAQMRKLGRVFDICSDEIRLEPQVSPQRASDDRPRDERPEVGG